jgi:ribosomal protein S18 acetylase RimI-like enzyme
MVDDTLTAAWDPVLRAQGFKFENQLPGMAMDLSRLPLLDLPAGLRIEPVRDPERLSTWVDTFILGYGVPVEMNAPFYRLMLALGLDGPVYNYLGWLDGQPVSVASLFSMDGIAGIYCVATVPAARRRGLGAALTLHALYESRAFGCTIGALQSSPMGFSVYERLGFQLTRRIEVYVKSLE